jgi:hypothetical protein
MPREKNPNESIEILAAMVISRMSILPLGFTPASDYTLMFNLKD